MIGPSGGSRSRDAETVPSQAESTWDVRFRRWFQRYLPWPRLLPGTEPVYVRSLLYVFGALNIASLVILIASGVVLAFFGPTWWKQAAAGRFTDAVHYWAVQIFFLCMLAHLVVVYLTGAFRGGRAATWILGFLAFLVATTTGLTGYSSAQDFDSQWITTQAKDAVNSIGAGGLLNLLNTGQVVGVHMIVLPLTVAIVVAIHVLLVRVHGVVPPYDALEEHLEAEVRS